MTDLFEGATDTVAINLEVLIEVNIERSTLEDNLCGDRYNNADYKR